MSADVTLIEMKYKLNAEIASAVDTCGKANDKALDHIEEAQQLLTAMRYRIWNTFHNSGVRG